MTAKPLSRGTTPGRSRGEIITRSSLPAGFIWPAYDPRSSSQPCRARADADWDLIRCSSCSPYFERDALRFTARQTPAAEAILQLLNHWAFQFNSRRRFLECEKWSRYIKIAIQANRAVEIMIPAFCVIANPIKRIDGHAITAAEDVSLLHLANLARFIKQIYSPGLIIHIVSDSNFYALPLGLTAVEAQRYFQQLRCRVCELKLDETLKVHDMVDLLLDHASLFRERFVYWRATYLHDPLCDGISAIEYMRWQSSTLNSINTQKLGLDYRELAVIFDPLATPRADDYDHHASIALAEYRAMKAAAADTGWEERHPQTRSARRFIQRRAPCWDFASIPSTNCDQRCCRITASPCSSLAIFLARQ